MVFEWCSAVVMYCTRELVYRCLHMLLYYENRTGITLIRAENFNARKSKLRRCDKLLLLPYYVLFIIITTFLLIEKAFHKILHIKMC